MRVSHLLKVTPIYYVYQAPESLISLKIKFANNLIAGTHILTDNFFLYKKKLGFTASKTEHPLQGMELQEKGAQRS